ncbi:MAG: DUF996 domain-containing protein [Candidatus Bathyarchaeota archaeon]|nr:DUF996 domain-containing protein [Candidatus Bathyarchaeota archaeon]
MTVASNRMLGMVGSLLMVVSGAGSVLTVAGNAASAVGTINWLVLGVFGGLLGLAGFVGIILFLVSMFGLSRDYKEHGIFNNILYGAIAFIATAAIVGVIIGITALLFSASELNPNLTPNPVSVVSIADTPSFTSELLSVSEPVIAGLATVMFAVFFIRSLNVLAEKSGVALFKTTAKVLLASAITIAVIDIVAAILVLNTSFSQTNFTIVTGLVGLLQYVVWGLLAASFFRIVPPPPEPEPLYTPPAPAVEVKYCHRCGAQNQLASQYCIKCGQKLATIED